MAPTISSQVATLYNKGIIGGVHFFFQIQGVEHPRREKGNLFARFVQIKLKNEAKTIAEGT